jgi:pilus assembly protein FimV
MSVFLSSVISHMRARVGLNRCARFGSMLLMLSAVVMSNADALMLGNIQVNSRLGQPLSAQIAFLDISDVDALQLKLHLANIDEYKKLDLQYPEGIKFTFRVVNEPGALVPFVRIVTQRPIDDPFVNLLIEVTAASGKLVKAYTFLLDPPSELASSDDAFSEEGKSLPVAKSMSDNVSVDSSKAAPRRKSRPRRVKKHAAVKKEPTARDSKSHMKLAMSLSISRYDPAAPVTQKEAGDALEEELIAKEKSLEELKSQIGEMQSVIKSLQDKTDPAAQSAPERAIAAQSEVAPQVASVAPQPGKLHVETPLAQPQPESASLSGTDWLNPLLAFLALLLGAAVLFGYRQYRRMHASKPGPFDNANDELHESEGVASLHANKLVVPTADRHVEAYPATLPILPPSAPVPSEPLPSAPLPSAPVPSAPVPSAPLPSAPSLSEADKPSLTFGEQSMEMPAYTEPASVPIVPPEYAILMEANKYLRSGKDKQAEEALVRAIEVNPKNTYGYHALLKLYVTRNDKAHFENIARQLKAIEDEESFEEAAEMGRKLDPGNPLYV